MHPTGPYVAPHARACCPEYALAALAPADLAALDRYCARALDDPDAEPDGEAERAAVARYEALLADRARDWWRAPAPPRRGPSHANAPRTGRRPRGSGGISALSPDRAPGTMIARGAPAGAPRTLPTRDRAQLRSTKIRDTSGRMTDTSLVVSVSTMLV
jgi:hypothetical protein